MGILFDAMQAAEERKLAVLGGASEPGIAWTGEAQARALLSGWDIDFAEFVELSQRAGPFFAQSAFAVPLPEACRSAWTDGLLIGLMLGVQQRER